MKWIWLGCLFCHGWVFAQERTITFGMVMDGPSPQFEKTWIPLLKEELRALLERDFQIAFPEEKSLRSHWSVDRIKAHLDQLLADDAVDVVLCIGALSTFEAASRGGSGGKVPAGAVSDEEETGSGPFPKPVIAPFGISVELPVYPRKGNASGVKNFNYTTSPGGLERDIRLLKQIKPVTKVHLIADALLAAMVPGLAEFVTEVFREADLEVAFVLGRTEAAALLDALPKDAQLVYLTPLLRFSDEEKKRLIEGLIARKLPSYSLLGREDVERGVLAASAPKSDTLRWIRRVALNVQRVLLGEDAGTLPVLLPVNSKLTLNMATARAIDWYPNWDLQIAADTLYDIAEEEARELDLAGAVLQAVAVNLDLQAATRDVAVGAEEQALTRARRLPRVDTDVQTVRVDEDTAAASLGSQAETTTSAAVSLQQLVYSDGVNAAVTIQNHLQRAREMALASRKLDLAQETAIRFLNYLKAEALRRIQQDNLDLTNANLETARLRRDIGISGPADVYRWESQYARDQRAAIDAWARSRSALAALNQILHFPQEAVIKAQAPNLLDPNLMTGRGRLGPYVDNAKNFEIFRGFMVAEGLRNAPELKQLDALIAAKGREALAAKRAYFLPTVSLQGQLNHHLDRSGVSNLDLMIPNLTLPQVEDTSWSAALNFNLPLFTGGVRKAELGRDRVEIEQLKIQRRALAERIELNIRTALQAVGAASVGINLSQAAAESARNNFDLVKDAYAKGLTSVTNLLDAQNAALVADEAAANAVYDFLIELMRFQRAAAHFNFFLTAEEREAFFQRLEEMYQQFR